MTITTYDNEGESFDRYTVIIEEEKSKGAVFGMSENPQSPDGFNQFCCTVEELNMAEMLTSKQVAFYDLPLQIQKAIAERLPSE